MVIAVGLAWLSFVQVPRADEQAQLLRQSAVKEAQFGQLDAGRFRSFISGGGDAVFYAERVDAEGVLHNVFVRRETIDRVEVALAETATYSKAATNGMHFVTLFNGRRYEGTPGRSDFRIIEFREHGIPIVTSEDKRRHGTGSGHPAHPGTLGLECARRHRAAAIQGLEPHHGADTDPPGGADEPAAPPSRPLCARGICDRGVHGLCEPALRRQGLGREGQLPPVIGVWWVHILALAFGLYLIRREERGA